MDQFLTPAVLVLTNGSNKQYQQYLNQLEQTLFQKLIAKNQLKSITLTAKTDEDKKKIFGNPDPTNGILLRFISNINNDLYESYQYYGLIKVYVNQFGQFMLRELLESNDSLTHTIQISKKRLFFILCCDQDTKPSPQLISRTQYIIKF